MKAVFTGTTAECAFRSGHTTRDFALLEETMVAVLAGEISLSPGAIAELKGAGMCSASVHRGRSTRSPMS